MSLASDHGVFAMLDGGDRYVFIRVVSTDLPEPEIACTMCRYPAGYGGVDICETHTRLGMGTVFRGSRFGKAELAASSAAFDHEPGRLRRALDELADMALPLEARRLVDKFIPVIDEFNDATTRASLAQSLAHLAKQSGDQNLADALLDRARTDLHGVLDFNDPIPRCPFSKSVTPTSHTEGTQTSKGG